MSSPTLILKPNVYLVGRPTLHMPELSRFIQEEGLSNWVLDVSYPAETLVETAGRLCYMSYGKGRKSNAEFMGNILASGHGSVIEHANWSFIFTGVSRSFTHELVRHRHLSFSQLSQRYVDESDTAFVMPEAIAKNESMHGTFIRALNTAKTAYEILVQNLELCYNHITDKTLKRKMARQAARAVLPNATETKIFVTGNARAWRHFVELRGSLHAETEIRAVAVQVLKHLKDEAPSIFADCEISTVEVGDGPLFDTTEIITVKHGGV